MARFLSAPSFAWSTRLFFVSVCAYFFALPLQSDTSAFIAVMGICAAIAAKTQEQGGFWRERAIRWPLWAFGVFILVALAAALLNLPVLRHFPRLALWLCCMLSGVVFGMTFPRNGGKYLWAVFAAIAASFVFAVLFQGYDTPSIWHDGRLKLFALHPSRLALYAATVFFFLLHEAAAGGKTGRFLAMTGVLFILFVLVKTNTRGNLFMLPFGVLCLGAALPGRYRKGFALAVLLCAVLAGGAIWTAKDGATGKRLISAATNVTEDVNFKSRLPIWEAGWESFKKSPAIGHGYHSYLQLHGDYVKERGPDLEKRYGFYERRVKQAHNIVLGRLVETGVLGTAAFFIFYFAAIVSAWRGAEENRWLVAPLVFYLGMSMLDDGLFRINDAFIFFLAGNAVASGVFRPVRSLPPGQ